MTNKAEVMTLLVNAGCKIDVHSKPGVFPVSLMRNRIHRLQNQSRLSKDELHKEAIMVGVILSHLDNVLYWNCLPVFSSAFVSMSLDKVCC